MLPRSESPVRRLLAEHRPFLLLLGGAALLRVLVLVSFPPAFVISDAPTYLRLVDVLEPSPDRTVGYGIWLRALAWLTRDVAAVALSQHLLGLACGVLVYVLLLRWGVRRRVALLATLPVLLDRMQLVLEHSALSDIVFEALLLLAVAVLAWRRRPTVGLAALAGLLLGLSVLVRVVGQPTVLAGVLFCLLAAPTVRARLATSAALVAMFVVPLVGYAAWYHAEQGSWALSEAGGRALYMRTTTFVDCARLEVPAYQRALCPDEPLGERLDPTWYGWHDPDGDHGLDPPDGSTPDEAMRSFALAAIREQPGDYVRVVLRDAVSSFAPLRLDYFEYDTAWKWGFWYYIDYEPTEWTGPAFAAHGGEPPRTHQPGAWVLGVYGFVVYLWGPVLLALLVVVGRGLLRRTPTGGLETRPLIVLLASLGTGLALAPILTAQFVWRYQLPMVVLVPVAAALAWERLRAPRPTASASASASASGDRAQPGTRATPRTD